MKHAVKKTSVFLSVLLLIILLLGAYLYLNHQTEKANNKNATAIPQPASTSQTVDFSKKIPLSKASDAVKKLRAGRGKNVVICLIDAASYYHMGYAGYPRPTTPNIDRLARESFSFEQHFCPFPMTKMSTPALFSSSHPDPKNSVGLEKLIKPSYTMAEGFRDNGYSTALFSSNTWVSPGWNICDGFDTVVSPDSIRKKLGIVSDEKPSQQQDAESAEEDNTWLKPETLLAEFSEWIEKNPKQPFFVYLHFLPPHSPYIAPDDMQKLFAGKPLPSIYPTSTLKKSDEAVAETYQADLQMVNLYDANLRWADWAVGEVEKLLKQAKVFDDTLFIITSDHGEALGEHGIKTHMECPFDEALHIPLLMRFPGKVKSPQSINTLTQTMDVLPTLVDLYELSYPVQKVEGKSLLPLMARDTDKLHDYIFACAGVRQVAATVYVARDKQMVLLLYTGGKQRALYDWRKDPGQTVNIINDEPEHTQLLLEAFRDFAATQPGKPLRFADAKAVVETDKEPAPERKMTEDEKKQLKTLGYL